MCVVITTTVVYLERADYRDLEGTIDSWLIWNLTGGTAGLQRAHRGAD